MDNEPNNKSIAPTPTGGAIVESRLASRGLELLDNLEFTTIVPAAILINNNQILMIEDAALSVDWDYRFTEWNEQIPRALALHYFTLDQQIYSSTTFFDLIRIDAQLVTQTFVINEEHLIVTETYELNPDSPSFSIDTDIVWAEQVLTIDGEFITMLTDNPTLLERFKQEDVRARAVIVSDRRYKPWSGVASKPIAGLRDTIHELSESHGTPDPHKWEDIRFIDASDVFRSLYEYPMAHEVTMTAFPLSELEHFLENVNPDYAYWDILPSGQVSVSKGNLYFSSDFNSVLMANKAQEYQFAGSTRAGCEVLINWAKPTSIWNPVHLTYCWVEKNQMNAIHLPSPLDELETLNRPGSLKYTFRDDHFEPALKDGIAYFICDEKYSKTSVIMAFDVRTSNLSPIAPMVPSNKSITLRHS